MQARGTTRKLKGGEGAQGEEEEEEGLLSIHSALRSAHWQTRAYGRDRDFGEVEAGTKMTPATSRFYLVCCPLSLLVDEQETVSQELEEHTVPVPEETANPEVEAKVERR
jgi:hypothetical protein